MSRDFDIVIWGATGFTGQLVVEYILSTYGEHSKFRWAIAARSAQKLNEITKHLAAQFPWIQQIPHIIADSFDRESLDLMVQRTRVICTTVGPYSQYGMELVASCVEHGTHYCDLTGETPFVRQMIDLHHQKAMEKKCRIVHFCGFDSIPSDIGVWMLQEDFYQQTKEYLDDIRFYMGPSKGGFSGGTIASMLHLFENLHDPTIRRTLGNPYALDPKDGTQKPNISDVIRPTYDTDIQKWISSFIMAGTNTRVVRRSHALLGYPFGHNFRYQEVMSMPNLWTCLGITFALSGFVSFIALSPTRKLLQKFILPQPGEGPTKKERDNGYFVIYLIGKKEGTIKMRATIKGQKDPGYGETAKMLAEAALCLALEELPENYGVITPSYAMGKPLLQRLRNAGMTFETTKHR